MQAPCLICRETNWQPVNHLKNADDDLSLCLTCGFVTYPEHVAKASDITEFYREDYRGAPRVENLDTGQRKLHYHESFLAPTVFADWQKRNVKKPVVFEVGAAFGLFLNHVKLKFPEADVSGSELTTTFRRNAWQEFKIRLDEEFDTSKRYDMIACYKVAEHIPEVGKEFDKYFDCLKEDGYLYISVPTWFHTMSNFGVDGFQLQCYYHKNHINVWTIGLFEALLKKHGFEIVHENHVYYDSTYVCRKNEKMKDVEPQYEEPAKVLALMEKIHAAAKSFDMGDFEGAIKHFPAFPLAHVMGYERARTKWHQLGFEAIEKGVIVPAIESCPNQKKMRMFAADICGRYEKFDQAIEHYKTAIEMAPGEANALNGIASIHRVMAVLEPQRATEHYEEAKRLTLLAAQCSPQHKRECVTMVYADNAKIPLPWEDECTKPTGQTSPTAT